MYMYMYALYIVYGVESSYELWWAPKIVYTCASYVAASSLLIFTDDSLVEELILIAVSLFVLSVCLFFCLCVCLCTCLSACLHVHVPVCLCVCVSIFLRVGWLVSWLSGLSVLFSFIPPFLSGCVCVCR